MAYIINKFNGEQLIVLEDGTIDTSTSVNLVGRNYVGYGESQNENFVYLLENFANDAPPSRPLKGQIWFNTSNNLAYAYDGSNWNPIGSAILSSTEPVNPNDGELWLKTPYNVLYVWNGASWSFIGPEHSEGFGVTRARSTSLSDSNGNPKPVIFLEIDNQVIAIISKVAFTINNTDSVSGFSNNLIAGINLSTVSKINGDITGNAYTADQFKTARTINGVPFNGANDITVKSSTTNKLKKGTYILGSDFDGSTETTWSVDATSSNSIGKLVARNSEGGFSAGTIAATFLGNLTGDVTSTGTSSFNIVQASQFVGATLTGNAGSATKLATARKINTVSFDGTTDITITSAAGTLTGDALASNVIFSSLTSLGTLTNLNVANAGINVGSAGQLRLFVDSSKPTIRSATGTLNFDMGPTGPDLSFVDSATALSLGGPNAPAILGDNTTNLGITGYKFDKIYANEFKGNADSATTAVTSTNIVGGGAGAIVYQSGIGTTTTLGLGADGYVLRARPSGPSWESLVFEQLNKGDYVNMVNTTTSGPVNYFNSSVPVTISVNATPNNTGSTVVARDTYGNFSANIVLASLFGNVTGNVTGNVSGNAGTVTNGVYTTGSYSNPSWITSLAGSKVTSIPNSSLQNSSITINGSSVSLGGSVTVNAGFGVSQNYVDVTSSRTLGTAYVNSTGKIIYCNVWIYSGDNDYDDPYQWAIAFVNGVEVDRDIWTRESGAPCWTMLRFFVPPGAQYYCNFYTTDEPVNNPSYGVQVNRWTEFR